MPEKPNIVLIITDQQRYDTIAALGFPQVHTPNLDRLVGEGVSFDHCYVNAPSCGPARCSFFSGLYPHSYGMLRNEQPLGAEPGPGRLFHRQHRQDALYAV